jgi:hypothetical protein
MAKWLYSLDGIDNIHINYTFRVVSNKRNLEIVKWLYSLGGVNIHANTDAVFKNHYYDYNYEFTNWLIGLDYHYYYKYIKDNRYERCYGMLNDIAWKRRKELLIMCYFEN